MTAAEITQAVKSAGYGIHECKEYADGVKIIVFKEATFREERRYYSSVYTVEVTAPHWFSVIGIQYTATASEIAGMLDRWYAADNREAGK